MKRKFIVVSGKGGVGRTTTAALLAMALAERGKKVLLATTGLDDRLAWMLGAERLLSTPQYMAKNLHVQRLEPIQSVVEYGTLILKSERLSKAFFGNKLVSRLLSALPGLDDFAVLGKAWHEAFRAGKHDIVIFDGPATGHLRLVLGVPKTMIDTIATGPLAKEASAMEATFRDPEKSTAVLVGLPEWWPLTELGELATSLEKEIGLGLSAVIVNAMWPCELPTFDLKIASEDVREVFSRMNEITTRGERQLTLVREWQEGQEEQSNANTDRTSLVRLPWILGGIDGTDTFNRLLNESGFMAEEASQASSESSSSASISNKN